MLMTRSLDQIAGDFDVLSAGDFNPNNTGANGIQRLYSLTDELLALNMPRESAELLLRFIERSSSFEGIDPRFDLGTPGPLVHTLERLQDYREHLESSIKRQPTPLTVLMINRILNDVKDQELRDTWLRLMRDCQSHPMSSSRTREEVDAFLIYQSNPERTG
jgi:hypothetical protein